MSATDIKAQQQGRSGLLDCIRAVAIILVIFFHVAVKYPGTGGAMEQFFMLRGSKGVDIFFPLSGFLITSFLLQSARPDFIKVFFLRRVFRILPLYVVMVTLAAAMMFVSGIDSYLLDRIWINYTFLTAWFIHFQGPNTVPYTITWSLSVEEFAYIIFGLAALVSRKALPLVLVLLSVLPFFLKLFYVSQSQGFYFLPIARIDSIAIGGLAAWLMITGRRPLLWLALALALCYGVSSMGLLFRDSLVLIILALWISLVMVAIGTWARDWRNPVIAAGASIGFYSYFIYLFHVFVVEGIFIVLPHVSVLPPFWVVGSTCLAITYVAAIVSYRWCEAPMMRFGRGLEGPRSAPEASLPEAPEEHAAKSIRS